VSNAYTRMCITDMLCKLCTYVMYMFRNMCVHVYVYTCMCMRMNTCRMMRVIMRVRVCEFDTVGEEGRVGCYSD
jgi:hypothetical protein